MLNEHAFASADLKQGGVKQLGQASRGWSLALRCFILAQQLGGIKLQHPSYLLNRLQARIVAAALERADIGPVKAGVIGKTLLREPLRFSSRPKVPSKKLAYVHETYNSQLQSILHGVYSSSFLTPASQRQISSILKTSGDP